MAFVCSVRSFDHGATHFVVLDVSQSRYESMVAWLFCDLVAIGMPASTFDSYMKTIGGLGLKKPLKLSTPTCPERARDPAAPIWLVAIIHHAP